MYVYEIPCNMCFFMFPLWAKVRSQLSHLKGLLPSWTVSICFSMNFFSVKLFPQTLHLWGLFPSWTDSTCLLRSAFSLRCKIFGFSPLVPSKREENILVFLSLYIFWGKCVYFLIFEWENKQIFRTLVKRLIWEGMLNQFMREKDLTNAIFVERVSQRRNTCLNI